jgi:hypothetical protein
MMAHDRIPWRHDLQAAEREAAQSDKLVLVDLFNPG